MAIAEPSKNLKSMRVSDLLRMSTGHHMETPPASRIKIWTKVFLALRRCLTSPARRACTTRPATYMLSAIVQKAAGMNDCSITCGRGSSIRWVFEHPTWETSPQGISTRARYGLAASAPRTSARFGAALLAEGQVAGQAVGAGSVGRSGHGTPRLPAGAIPRVTGIKATATSSGVPATVPTAATARFGQYCVVIPEQDAVIAITKRPEGNAARPGSALGQAAPGHEAGNALGHR